jgi:hypothetical protein
MTWAFERNGERLRCTIAKDDAAGCYRLSVRWPDGSDTFEDIDHPTVLIERSVQMMDGLRRDGWLVSSTRREA